MMKLKIKDVDIATGGPLVAILNKHEAAEFDLHVGDRLKITKGKNHAVAILDIAETSHLIRKGEIGLMEETLSRLDANKNEMVHIFLEEKPVSLTFIKKKLDGKTLAVEEINTIIKDIVENRLTDIEITYFVAGTYMHSMTLEETVALTKAMINTGDILKIDRHPIVDKHCIGGVAGNRTTMVVVPILIAAGYCMPKTSSRSITSPAGTADTMEVLADVVLPMEDIKKTVDRVGGCIVWGGAVNLAPADDKIITVEHPLSIDAEGQLLASILAKKGSVSATHVLIDIPVGKGSKLEDRSEAKHLKKMFERIGERVNMEIHCVITDGSQPIGRGIGPALEARDVLYVLMNHKDAPLDLKEKCLDMAGRIMTLYPLPYWKAKHGHKYAREILESGKAYEVMKKIIEAQGKKADRPEQIRIGRFTYDHTAWKDGTVKSISSAIVARVAKDAGAPGDAGAGIYLHHHVGERVKKNDVLYTVYAESRQKLDFAKELLKREDGIEMEDA